MSKVVVVAVVEVEVVVVTHGGGGKGGRRLVGEETGEGLAEAADGLRLGLVVGGVPSQRLGEGVGQGLGLTAKETVDAAVS